MEDEEVLEAIKHTLEAAYNEHIQDKKTVTITIKGYTVIVGRPDNWNYLIYDGKKLLRETNMLTAAANWLIEH